MAVFLSETINTELLINVHHLRLKHAAVAWQTERHVKRNVSRVDRTTMTNYINMHLNNTIPSNIHTLTTRNKIFCN